MEPEIRFCAGPDGVRIAYASHGRGPAIVKTGPWFSHLEHDWRSPVWRHWLEHLSDGYRLVRYDWRGSGLSDRDPADVTLELLISDLEAVVDAAGLERFAILGACQGGAVAVEYAARQPERVSHLVLYGSYVRGRQRRAGTAREREEVELLQQIVRVGWGGEDPAFRRLYTSRFVPDGTPEQMRWFDELQRVSVSPETAARLRAVWQDVDVGESLGHVRAPTLVAHVRGDRVVPFDEGRALATGIPDARFLPLQGRNHIALADDAAWTQFLEAVREFVRRPEPVPAAAEELTPRELEVVRLAAEGLANDEIAVRLALSVRTVERHLSNVYAKLRLSGKSARAAAVARVLRID